MEITYHHTFTLDCLPPGSIFRCDDDYYPYYLGKYFLKSDCSKKDEHYDTIILCVNISNGTYYYFNKNLKISKVNYELIIEE